MNIVLLMNLAAVNAVKREPVSEPVERYALLANTDDTDL